MGSPSIPAAPAAPDYAAANREGIVSDISNLPLRNRINAAARLGQKITYIDPADGQEKTADFTGSGDAAYAGQAAALAAATNASTQRDQLALRRELGVANAQQTAAELRAADPAAYAARQALTGTISDSLAGKADYAAYVRTNPDLAEAFARERDENGGTLSIEEWGKRHYDTYGQNEGRELTRTGTQPSNIETDTSAGRLNDRVRDLQGKIPTGGGRLTDLYDEANGKLSGDVTDDSQEGLRQAYQQAQAEFALGGKLDPDTMRDLLNETRAGQAARGNYLGDAAAVAEATNVGSAMEARKAQRLKTLQDVQSQVFGQNSALRNEQRTAETQRLGTLATLAGQDYGQQNQWWGNQMAGLGQENALNVQQLNENRATRNENYARDQQKLANASSMVLGQPLTNQFGSLQGAQNGAVAYNPTAFQSGAQTTNANAGQQAASFAQGNYGTQANIWNTQAGIASQGNPWMSLVGNIAGSALGGMGSGMGSALGKAWGG